MSEARKVFLARRVLISQLGGGIVIPVRGFTTEDVAKSFVDEMMGRDNSLMTCTVVSTPNLVPPMANMGTLAAILNSLGINQISYDHIGITPHESNLLVPPPGKIVLPS